RIDDAIDQQEAAEKDDQHGDVHVGLVREVNEPEQLSAWHRLDTILAVRERRLDGEEVHHLRQRERDHGKVDALPTDREGAHDRAEAGGGGGSRQDCELLREAPYLGRMRAYIARPAEDQCVSERKQTAVTEQ